MALAQTEALGGVNTAAVERLGPADCQDLLALYRDGYPESWFDPWTLESGYYFRIRGEGMLLSVAGVHVVSAAQRVAACSR